MIVNVNNQSYVHFYVYILTFVPPVAIFIDINIEEELDEMSRIPQKMDIIL